MTEQARIEMQIMVNLQVVSEIVVWAVRPLAGLATWNRLQEELDNGFQFFAQKGDVITVKEFSTITNQTKWYDVVLTESGWKIKR